MSSRNYVLFVALVPEDERGQVRFTDDSMHVQLPMRIRGKPTQMAPMLFNLAVDVENSITQEIMKGSSNYAS